MPVKSPRQIDPEQLRSILDKHRAEPNISTDRYVRARKLALGESVLQRERIYLDLNYWLRLRDVVLGRRSDPRLVTLLSTLRDSVRERRSICPISDSTFLELLKQQDIQTRLASAELIDELSEGVSLIPLKERMATEVAHFLYTALGHRTLPRTQLVWSKLSHILGVVHPHVDGLDIVAQHAWQKAFFDYMWDIPLSNMVSMLDADLLRTVEMDDIADHLNENIAQHSSTIKSFKKVYEDEFVGLLDLAAEAGQQVLEQMWIESASYNGDPTEEQRTETRQQVFGLLRATFRHKRSSIVSALPSFQIGALCHAAVRWDRKRKLTGNDLFDFHHAQAALPYCNVFLTEKPLHTLLRQKHVSIESTQFPCRVASSLDEAVALLC